MKAPLLLGVDFTSAPSRRKPITVARGELRANGLQLAGIESCADWASFEAVLARPGPWLGGFDFPFGLPRALVEQLGWPQDWAGLIQHIHTLGKPAFKAALDAVREGRPMGSRYLHRACDGPARSHSPMKLVNPPVGLMFFEGAPRLLSAGLSLPGLHAGDPQRLALEAYPALLARRFTQASYKSDERAKQTLERRAEREKIIAGLCAGAAGPVLDLPSALAAQLLDDASGDSLDAVLALLQAAHAWLLRDEGFGLPAGVDPLEGWIVGCPR
ncbi:DUF429 domain-containing protein [Uliginosibacterium sp. TH139]|uniref:DUF429 domain-containing protein n=1 Tax=Uliginosibacterium sp. TH139 TaxID=2067453 RepID=UPI000C7E1D8F|nr:DUF429 domain-containing protein [Uliginosibacterium sp. TH139]PLK50277.1 DUF429 domain-containing protein [Uliginosibacterium sp. TH139]